MVEKEIKKLLEKNWEAKIIILTDLDATLLDHNTYSFKPALDAINLAKSKGIDIIFVTSKTKAETELYRKSMDINKPFIVENGGALYIPSGHFKKYLIGEPLGIVNGMLVKIFGLRRDELLDIMVDIKTVSRLKINNMAEMSIDEISAITFLSQDESELARMREYSEPFIIQNKISDSEEVDLINIIKSKGLNVTKGGRFYHLMGENDKGKAALYLIEIYRKFHKCKIISIGIGDSKNDIPLLKNVDIPIAVQRPEGEYNSNLIEETSPFLSGGIGPFGWNKGLLKIFSLLN